MKTLYIVTLFVATWLFAYAGSTDIRTFTSSKGKKVRASALELSGDTVKLKNAKGRVFSVKLSALSEEDQNFLKQHFAKLTAEETSTKIEEDTNSSEITVGEVQAVTTPEGSNYYLYVPSTAKLYEAAPLLFYTNANGGKKGLINGLTEVAEVLGWVVAVSVESKNKASREDNLRHSKNCILHIMGKHAIDKDRIHYTGYSGGGALASYNTHQFKAFGIMPCAAYLPMEAKKVKAEVAYFITGAQDYNRYISAKGASDFKRDGYHRIFKGNHHNPKAIYRADGMLWMHCKYLAKKKVGSSEKSQLTKRTVNWLKLMKSSDPERAYHNALVLKEVVDSSELDSLIATLGDSEKNKLYAAGIDEINDLAKKTMSQLGQGSRRKHTDSSTSKAANKLKSKYKANSRIVEILEGLTKKTN